MQPKTGISFQNLARNLLRKTPWQKRLAVLLYMISAAFVIYLVVLIVLTPFYIRRMKESMSQTVGSQIGTLPLLKQLSAYQEVINQHPLFGIAKQKTVAPPVSPCDEFKTKYVLAGIVGGAENEALFNSKMGRQTYIAKAGESIEGVSIETVRANGVLLNCSGKKVEMTMEES